MGPFGSNWPYGESPLYKDDGTVAAIDKLHYYALKKTFPIKDIAGVFDANFEIQGQYLDQCYFQGMSLEKEIFPDTAVLGDTTSSFERVFDSTTMAQVFTKYTDLTHKDQRMNPYRLIADASKFGYDATIYENIHDMFVVHSDTLYATHIPHAIYDRAHAWEFDFKVLSGSSLPADRTNLMENITPKIPAFTKINYEFGYQVYACDNDTSGYLYAQANGSGNFNSVAGSAIGVNAVTVAHNGDVYVNGSNGNLYKQSQGSGPFTSLGTYYFSGITGAPNGDIYGCTSSGNIYQQNGGVGSFSLIQTLGGGPLISMAAGPTGDIYVCSQGTDIYKRTSGLGSFTGLGAGALMWIAVTVTKTNNVYATENGGMGGDIYKQTNATGPFNALGQTIRQWTGLSATPDNNVYACENLLYSMTTGDIYKLTNEIGNFIALGQTYRDWFGMGCSGLI
jgi:hypothetical protein